MKYFSLVLVVLIFISLLYMVIKLISKISTRKCPRCGKRMATAESKTVFEGAANIEGNNAFPRLIIKREICSQCGNEHNKLSIPYESSMRHIKGDIIKEYFHLEDSDVIEHYQNIMQNKTLEPLSKLVSLDSIRGSNDQKHGKLPPTGIAISEDAFRFIYQSTLDFIKKNNRKAGFN